MPFHIRRTLLCDSLDTIRLPSFGPYPPSLICLPRVVSFLGDYYGHATPSAQKRLYWESHPHREEYLEEDYQAAYVEAILDE